MHELDLRDAYLDFIIALESLLLKENEPTKGLFAERVALIMGDNADSREQIFTRVKDLYQMRSNIVHRGFNDITKLNVKEVSHIAFMVIMTPLKQNNNIKTIDDLAQKCNDIKFAGPMF